MMLPRRIITKGIIFVGLSQIKDATALVVEEGDSAVSFLKAYQLREVRQREVCNFGEVWVLLRIAEYCSKENAVVSNIVFWDMYLHRNMYGGWHINLLAGLPPKKLYN